MARIREALVQFRALPDVHAFLATKREQEACTLNYLLNHAIRQEMKRSGYSPSAIAGRDNLRKLSERQEG